MTFGVKKNQKLVKRYELTFVNNSGSKAIYKPHDVDRDVLKTIKYYCDEGYSLESITEIPM